MLPVLSSRLWYHDGSAVVGHGDAPPQAPRRGVELIAYYHEPPYVTYAHGDWEGYRWKESGEWFASGPTMPDADWEALHKRAMSAPRP